MIAEAAAVHGEAPALLAPGREPLNYGALARQIARVAGQLRAAGIRATDRIAVVLPNGPEMAAAFLAIGASAGCAPLNPNYTRQDFEFYLQDLKARALLVDEAPPEPAIAAAKALGVEVLTIRRLARAGEFDLPACGDSNVPDWPGAGDVALLLHTSGTTSRPKLVPLSAGNLTTSAAHIVRTLALTPADRCLNIMPLFHIHGLMAAVMATLRAGASVVCTDGVYANRFFDWMREFQPTWYTAVPTFHQRILAEAGKHAEVVRSTALRFIRSSSASMPPAVLDELERVFGAPVIEAYGMTEAAHQMASTPLPPALRKAGSVGPAAGPEVAVMDGAGRVLPPRQTGEIVIRGPNVTSGYEANPAANAAAFTDGWFRTGDQGWLDEDGYLFLTGRLKELINRGGEKISPREIDEVLLAHPAVRQAVAFAVPHAQLGEDVGAAVELITEHQADEADLRRWAGERLAPFKVPRVVRIVEAIPKGPTGKLQRIGLARKLGIEELDDRRLTLTGTAPRTPLEQRLAGIWRQLLPGTQIGVEDRFEAFGGDSLLAARMLAAVGSAEGFNGPWPRFAAEGTIAALAADIESAGGASGPIVVLQPRGDRTPLCCLPGHDGALLGLTHLANGLGPDQPLWAIDHTRLPDADSVEAVASQCVEHLRRVLPSGPYHLAGVCFGGLVAYEMARILRTQGETVGLLALIDCLNPAWKTNESVASVARAKGRQWKSKLAWHSGTLRDMSVSQSIRYVASRVAAFCRNHAELSATRLGIAGPSLRGRRMMRFYVPQPWDGDAVLIRLIGRRLDAPALGWTGLIRGRTEVVDLPFHPHGCLSAARVTATAAAVSEALDAALSTQNRKFLKPAK